jgi:hypothetical protein
MCRFGLASLNIIIAWLKNAFLRELAENAKYYLFEKAFYKGIFFFIEQVPFLNIAVNNLGLPGLLGND